MAENKMITISLDVSRQKIRDRLKANTKNSLRILTVAEAGKEINANRFYI